MPTVTESIQNFLRARHKDHNGPDLLDRWGPFIETQVNVSAGKGEPVDGKRNTWTDGIYEWWNIRIPKNANSEPEFRDYKLDWPLDPYVEGIGSTGWDWCARKSRWFGFDFDSITGHAAGVGVTDAELERVKAAAQAIPYVEVRRSTGGNGLHLYVYLDGEAVPTQNHTEHAALARAVLSMMASEAGFDFARQIDVCGGNMWIWHKKMTEANQGLALLKSAERTLTAADLPPNWKDHVEVVTRRRAKVRIGAVEDSELDPFEALTSSRKIIPLDESHKKIIDELLQSGYSTIWVPDHHLLQTHTKALADLMETLPLQGFFKTISRGADRGTPNCFLFPLDKGGFKVYRFSQGTNEAETWTQDGDGWTTCFYNRQPDLHVAAKAMGGLKDPEQGGYVFDTAEKAIAAAAALGQKVVIPEKMLNREARLKSSKEGTLVVHIQKSESDEGMAGWIAKKDKWVRAYDVRTDFKRDDVGHAEYDPILRLLYTPVGKKAARYIKGKDGHWRECSTEDVKFALARLGHSDAETKFILGGSVFEPWTLVNLPFQPEYVGGRQWNLDAAQYRYQPAALSDDQAPNHPHWDRILRHCGQDLDATLKDEEWAVRGNIRSGGQYLMHWMACCLREPFEPLPYLFFYGEQNSGKSIFHEAMALLMTKGVAAADRALTNSQDFNGELSSAVLCYIEEKDISIAGESAYNKIKDWVTSRMISIRKMRTDSYTQPNTTHWCQCANKREACPIWPGDTRITMMYVPDLQPGEEIPKKILIERLEAEAPHFMRTLMDLQLPAVEGRLRLPIVNTQNKRRAEELNRDPVQRFILEHCHDIPGQLILFSEFFDRFVESLNDEEKYEWTKARVSKAIPDKYPAGAFTGNKKYIGNIAWSPAEASLPFFATGGKLRRKAAD